MHLSTDPMLHCTYADAARAPLFPACIGRMASHGSPVDRGPRPRRTLAACSARARASAPQSLRRPAGRPPPPREDRCRCSAHSNARSMERCSEAAVVCLAGWSSTRGRPRDPYDVREREAGRGPHTSPPPRSTIHSNSEYVRVCKNVQAYAMQNRIAISSRR